MDNRALNLAAIRLAKEENVQYLQALTKHIVGSWHPIPSVSALRSSDDWQVFMVWSVGSQRSVCSWWTGIRRLLTWFGVLE
jgi:hypothetical protein